MVTCTVVNNLRVYKDMKPKMCVCKSYVESFISLYTNKSLVMGIQT